MRRLLGVFLLLSLNLPAQDVSGPAREAAVRQFSEASKNSILARYPVRNIGPTIQGGRIVDIEVHPRNPHEFYLAFASGGIFKTVNNGITFEPVFDHSETLIMGDMALSQRNPLVMYVGTGEKNSSRSSYAGAGIFKTTDGGKTWQPLGLSETHRIGRVVIHPQNDEVVWVAALGPLYSDSPHRGVYKTIDGGKTWKKTLYVNDSTGCIDLVVNPRNPDQLLAAMWEKDRKAWNFKESGQASSIYRSDDGGETWYKAVTGFPQGAHVGRIGLDVCLSQPSVVYAILDNQAELPREDKPRETDKLQPADFKDMSREALLALDDKKLENFLRDNRFPQKYDAQKVKREVRENKYSPRAIYDYLGGDANASLFTTRITGAEVYRSEDFGNTWKKMNNYPLEGVFFTYGYYFAEMKVDPSDCNKVYIYGVPLLKSTDGGSTWHRLDTLRGEMDVHVDHHALWINPSNSKHLLLGNDGGLYVSYDEGAYWKHINNMPVGQFYTVQVDMETPYHVYGGLQDNGVLKGSSRSVPNITRHWERIGGGDGMYVIPDPRDSRRVYWGFQFGNYFRSEPGKAPVRITPRHDIGEPAYRWNWRTPVVLSRHNPDILYMGAQKVFRSLNRGESWDVISDDLTTNRPQGDVPFSTITALAESPLKFGLLYAGTDDGQLWVSRNGGGTWQKIHTGLPPAKWVSSIFPSPHQEGTVFVSLNGYREDDFRTYLFMSTDYGQSWVSIKGNMPESVANVIIQDPVVPDLLYAGMDNGTWVSFDRGNSWHFFTGMLHVPAYDMVVHPRDNELVVATHGRSVFIADVKPLQKLRTPSTPIMAFQPDNIRHSDQWGKSQYPWSNPVKPVLPVLFYTATNQNQVAVQILDEKKNTIRSLNISGKAGFNTFEWDLQVSDEKIAVPGKKKAGMASAPLRYADKGKYTIRFTAGQHSSEVTVEIN